MRRTIVEPADISGEALADLKKWLGITRPNDDDLLIDLLNGALAVCESFTRQVPISQLVEERAPITAGVTTLVSRPVASLATVEVVAQDGTRTTLDASAFEFALETPGSARFKLKLSVDGQAIAIRVRAGISATWAELPAPLRQGIIRLCAFQYRDRDRTGGDKAEAMPPTSVAALWRPWRTIRLV